MLRNKINLKFVQITLIVFYVLSVNPILSQENLIPNPGFEGYLETPFKWFYRGSDFDKVLQYWNSPTPASPDVYGPGISPPREWKSMGFGAQKAKSGKSMVGLTLYGCEDGKPHCREYIQVLLNEALIPGQNYHIEFWASHLPRSLRVNNVGVHFSESAICEPFDERIEVAPSLNIIEIISCPFNSWQKVSLSFTARASASYMIIGNFHTDEETKILQKKDALKYAYYYFDDFRLIKRPPILDPPKEDNDLMDADLSQGNTIVLENIYFDLDRSSFVPRSYQQLNKLYNLMMQYPDMEIEIHGHTDYWGSDEYNQELSRDRAIAVIDYLESRGINSSRLSYKAFGSSKPLESNETSNGRKKNRRVAFKVLRK